MFAYLIVCACMCVLAVYALGLVTVGGRSFGKLNFIGCLPIWRKTVLINNSPLSLFSHNTYTRTHTHERALVWFMRSKSTAITNSHKNFKFYCQRVVFEVTNRLLLASCVRMFV